MKEYVFGFKLAAAIENNFKNSFSSASNQILELNKKLYEHNNIAQWDSSTGFVGLTKKATIFLIVAMCHWADEAIKTDLLRQMAVCAYALNELGSNLENIDKAGYGGIIPAGVRKMLARLRAKTEN